LFLVVSISAIDCLERLVSAVTYCVSSETLTHTHSLLSYLPGHYTVEEGKVSMMYTVGCTM